MIKGSNNISRLVLSNQDGIHPDLNKIVTKHSQSSFRRPIAEHTLQAFQSIEKRVATDPRALILDSGCGIGESSINLAKQYRDCLVIGVDQSQHRLDKNYAQAGQAGGIENLVLLRADCVDFWRLGVQAGWQLCKHYILYPNPWPKKAHIKRRWHGHPVLKNLLELGGEFELRSNWSVYVAEFAQALTLLGYTVQQHGELVCDNTYLTPFERKYALSGQSLFSLQANLNQQKIKRT